MKRDSSSLLWRVGVVVRHHYGRCDAKNESGTDRLSITAQDSGGDFVGIFASNAAICEMMPSGSAMRPGPIWPQLSQPFPGSAK